jgi:hypothetical protein
VHPAEHRGLRELLSAARALVEHWPRLASRLQPDEAAPLRAGATAAAGLVRELEPLLTARGLSTRPTAQGLGARAAAVRATVVDRTLEVNQTLRLATLSIQHVVTTLRYLERLAAVRGDAELGGALGRWAERLVEHEQAARGLAVALGDAPERAVEPAVPGASGRVGHALAFAVGNLGERIDQLAGRRGGHERRA